MEGANALSRLQDDFLPMVENLPNISIISVRGCIHAALAKFCVAFSKATVTLAGIGAAGRIILGRWIESVEGGCICAYLQDDFLVPEEGLRSKIFQYFDNSGAGDVSL